MSELWSFEQIESQLLLTKRYSLLINLLFHKVSAEEEIKLYENLVFDDEQQSFLLLLARLAKRSNFSYAPTELIPRLQGLLRYHSVNNKLVMQPAITLLDKLDPSSAMLCGNSAMYGYYDAQNPRLMGISDLSTTPNDADSILNCAKNAGFQIQTESSLAVNLKNSQGNVNLIKVLHPQADSLIFEQSKQVLFQNRSVLIPNCIDTLILLLRSEFRWRCIQPRFTSNIKWYYDCACLIEHIDFSGWNALASRAAQLDSVQTIRVMLELFDQSLPGWIPDGFLQSLAGYDKKAMSLALQYGFMGKQYEAIIDKPFIAKLPLWFPVMRTKYHYLNCEISYANRPVSVLCFLRQHWGVTRLIQLPLLLWNRMKNKKRKEDA